MVKSNKSIIFLLLLIVTIISVYQLSTQNFFNKSTEIEIQVLKCKPQKQTCEIVTEDFNIEISLNENIFYLKPFIISVLIENKLNDSIESVQIDFKMKGMNMGVNRFMLTQKSIKDKKQEWEGNALLPICVAERADWFAEFEIVTKMKKYIFSVPVNVKQVSN